MSARKTSTAAALLALSLFVGEIGSRAAAAPSMNPLDYTQGGPTDYFNVSDGTSIAITVCYPNNYVTGQKYPAILEMAGYENGSQGITYDANGNPHCTGRTTLGQLRDWFAANSSSNPPDPPLSGDSDNGAMGEHHHDSYFVLHASMRGTGCSAGEFDLFSQQSALDGYDIIEHYIVNQSWSNQTVGIIGHSYSGITGSFVAEQQPPHLVAAAVSGLIDDLYRGITYPGGIFNALFPPEWTLGVRPAYDVLGGSLQGIVRPLRDRSAIAEQCIANLATHRRNIIDDPVLHGISQTDSEWFHARSLINHVDRINVPFMITGAFQDEQTGPRFAHFWEKIKGVPKRMIMTNGDHGTNVDPALLWKDRVAWIDYFMRGPSANPYYTSIAFNPATTPVSVRTLFELSNDNTTTEIKDSTSFPLPSSEATWVPFYVSDIDPTTGSGHLSTTQPTGSAQSVSYVSGTKRQSWSYEVNSDTGVNPGPPATTRHALDELEFRYAVPTTAPPLVIDGPITANLHLATSGTDTDLFVQIIDEWPGGTQMSILQRGLLRASHAAGIEYDPGYSDYSGTDPVNGGPFLYRPWRTHSNPQTIIPESINEYLVEVFPVAHIFRSGHTLLVKLMQPPAVDSQYSYAPSTSPVTLNTLYYGAGALSRVTLPVLNDNNLGFTINETGVACNNYHSVRCVSE